MKTINKICSMAIILLTVAIYPAFPQATIEENIQNAQKAFARLDQSNNYTEQLNYADMNRMPVGIHKTLNNTDVTLAVSGAEFQKQYVLFDAFLRIIIPEQNNKKLYFGAKGLKLSYDGNVIGDAQLTLLGDVDIPLSGGNVIFRLKGGFNRQTGQMADLTYATIDCQGFKALGLTAEVELSPSLCYPVDANGDSIAGKVTGMIQTKMDGWNDIIAGVNFPTFAIRGLKDFAWTLDDAVFDFSDVRNSDNIAFPEGYEQNYLPSTKTLWRGVYAKKIGVILPPQFSANDNRRLGFSAENMIIDDNGITGIFSAHNIVSADNGNAGGWAFSIDYFGLQLEANNLIGAKFNGEIGLPVSEKDRLKYTGEIGANDIYVLQIQNLDNISFDMLQAKATLEPNSYIKLTVQNKKFMPEALLHGRMGVYLKDSTNNNSGGSELAKFEGIVFNSLKLQSVNPYLSVQYLGYNGEVKLMNFPVSVANIGLTARGDRASLGMDVKLTLSDGAFTGSTRIEIGGVFENGARQRWKYDKFSIDAIGINATIAETFTLKGSLQIMRGNPVYGDGFGGELGLKFTDKSPLKGLDVQVRGMFGRTDFRYWFVDGIANLPGQGIPVGAGIYLTGFGGGVTYRMKPQGLQSGSGNVLSATAMSYIPDQNSSIGIKAAVAFAIPKRETAHGEACFELSFNNNGGLDYAGFFGYAEFAKEIKGLQNFAEKANSAYSKIIEKEKAFLANNSNAEAKLKQFKQYEPNQMAAIVEDPAAFATVQIKATLGIQFNFAEQSFHATSDLYVTSPFIRGTASNNRAGFLVMHIDPQQWYVHIGTPSNRIGLRMAIGNWLAVETSSYLMVGTNIPAAPEVPSQVASILKERPANLNYMKDLNSIGAGNGFAFGSSLSISTGDLTFLILYANYSAGLGFDVMLKDYGETQCHGRSGAIGMNGWYASGQAYAYMHGELGVKVNLWFVKGKFPIITADFATLMQAKLPNPSSFKAYIAAQTSLLGGLVNVNCRFKMLVGEDCEMVLPGGSPLDMPIISDLSPTDADNEISVFTAPQARFNMAAGKSFKMQDDSGEKTFRITLREFTLSDGQNIAGELKWNAAKDAVSFYSQEVLPPKQRITATVSVGFEELKGGTWRPVYTAGKEARETKTIAFTTSDAPKNIPLNNIVYAYPVIDQQHYLKDESNKGIIQLRTGQNYLFPANLKNQIALEDASGNRQYVDFVYNESQKRIAYTIPTGINNNAKYKISIVSLNTEAGNKGQQNAVQNLSSDEETGSITVESRQATAEQRTDIGTVLLAYNFAASAYSTLKQKIENIQKVRATASIISSDILMFGYEMSNMEPFELAELTGTEHTNSRPLIGVSAMMDDYFYTQKIYPLVYKNYPVDNRFTVSRNDVALTGVPPTRAIPIRTDYLSRIEQGETTGFVRQRFPYSYNLPAYYKMDFVDLQKQVVSALAKQGDETYRHFAQGTFPFISAGEYRIKLEYELPNGDKGTSAVFNYVNIVE